MQMEFLPYIILTWLTMGLTGVFLIWVFDHGRLSAKDWLQVWAVCLLGGPFALLAIIRSL